MISLCVVMVIAGLAAESTFAATPTKCPELVNVPSDSSSVIFAGVVQDLLVPEENGNYKAMLIVEEVLLGEEAMEVHLSKYSKARYVRAHPSHSYCSCGQCVA